MNFRNRIKELRSVPAADLVENPRNWRRHPDHQKSAMRGILSDVGVAAACVAFENEDGNLELIDGHCRTEILAGQEVSVLILDVNREEADQLLASMDPISALAVHDKTALRDLINDLRPLDTSWLENVFPSNDQDGAITSESDRQEQVSALDEKWGVQSGDIWEAGSQTIICGKSEEIDPEKYIKQETLFFDPPWEAMTAVPGEYASILGFADARRAGDLLKIYPIPAWIFTWDCMNCAMTPNRPVTRAKFCFWYGDVKKYNKDGALLERKKDPGGPKKIKSNKGETMYIPNQMGLQLCDIYQSSIVVEHSEEGHHRHGKPLEWIRALVANCTSGDIYDPFAGGGTCAVACEQLARRSLSVEMQTGNVAIMLEAMRKIGRNPTRKNIVQMNSKKIRKKSI